MARRKCEKCKPCTVCGKEIKRTAAWLCRDCYKKYSRLKRLLEERLKYSRPGVSEVRRELDKYLRIDERTAQKRAKRENIKTDKGTIRKVNGKIVETRGQYAWGPTTRF